MNRLRRLRRCHCRSHHAETGRHVEDCPRSKDYDGWLDPRWLRRLTGTRLIFDPNWVVHPGASLADYIAENPGLEADLVSRLGRRHLDGILDGSEPLCYADASTIAVFTGASTRFWWALERNFRSGLAAGKTWPDRPKESP